MNLRLPVLLALASGALAAPLGAVETADPGRLARDVVPTFQSVRLVLDPAQADYRGTAHVELNVARPTAAFGFHAEGPVLSTLKLRGAGGEVPLRHTVGARGLVRVEADRPIPHGAYTLDIDFEAPFDTRAAGLYRATVRGESYAFTQFEADDARKAFPCWDEPAFKFPYQLTVVVPEKDLAVSNMPIESETASAGQKTIVFKRTPPLPSYLLAIAVGPFDTVPIPGLSVPGRVVTVKGSGTMAAEAARITPPLVAALERYFGRPYPFEKLDLIAVPEFWPGAMENAGAITFAEAVLLVNQAAGAQQEQRLVEVTAHELAHMWFGDLVTMAWWDDLWLNESFASWMGDKVAQEVAPELEAAVSSAEAADYAMTVDSQLQARAIRQPVRVLDNLVQSADVLAYDKGQAVLGMFEAWIGPELFRKGIRDYLAAHEWENATASDLWSALSKAAGKDVGRPMETFLDQPGVPLVTAELVDGGKAVRLTQRRFVNAGAVAPPTVWQIPVALKYADGGEMQRKTVLLTQRAQDFKLEAANPPVIWLYPNAGERGYYRWSVARPLLTTISEQASTRLEPRERVGLIGNLSGLLAGGELHGGDFYRVLASFARDPEPEVVQAMQLPLFVMESALVTPDVRGAYGTYLRKTMGPALESIGPAARPGEAPAVGALRSLLINWLGTSGEDPRVVAYAKELTSAYLADPARVDPSIAGAALAVAAAHGDRGLFDALRQRFETTSVPADRSRLLYALGRFRDPALGEEALRFALAPAVRPQEVLAIPRALMTESDMRERTSRWLLEHYDEIAGRVPQMVVAFLPARALRQVCSADRLAQVRRFFSDPKHLAPGTEKELAKATEAVQDCIALRAREGASATAYLRTFDPR